jgi:hypothetical protein
MERGRRPKAIGGKRQRNEGARARPPRRTSRLLPQGRDRKQAIGSRAGAVAVVEAAQPPVSNSALSPASTSLHPAGATIAS